MFLLELRVCLVLALVQYASITFRIWASSSRAAVPEREKGYFICQSLHARKTGTNVLEQLNRTKFKKKWDSFKKTNASELNKNFHYRSQKDADLLEPSAI